jgi:16S rRNA (cytosine967-C5)-methyltransferase
LRRRNVRAIAAEMLERVAFRHRSLDRVLAETSVAESDRSLAHEIVYGTTRHYYSLAGEVHRRLNAPLKPRDSIVLCLLVVGMYQLRYMSVPNYAAVNETVAAAAQIGRPWARGLVNKLLRRATTEGPLQPQTAEQALDHPSWLIRLLEHDLPGNWRAVLEASLTRAPLTLRINLARVERHAYLEQLATIGATALTTQFAECIVLQDPMPTARIPGFAEGLVSVQDISAMWPARLLQPRGGERVLDACAAPGGKSMHLLERAPQVALTALDVDTARCATLASECARCGVDPGIVVCGDATRIDWWDGRPYDAILLDAPCSGTGTLRRHPDIKLLKRESDIRQYARTQGDLLANLWQVLATDGRLLYCTCSVLSAENDAVVSGFVSRTPNARVQPLDIPGAIETPLGRQLLPSAGGGDGFYFALITKQRRPDQ